MRRRFSAVLYKEGSLNWFTRAQNGHTGTLGILRMRNILASTVIFFYKEIGGEIRIFVIKPAILTGLSR